MTCRWCAYENALFLLILFSIWYAKSTSVMTHWSLRACKDHALSFGQGKTQICSTVTCWGPQRTVRTCDLPDIVTHVPISVLQGLEKRPTFPFTDLGLKLQASLSVQCTSPAVTDTLEFEGLEVKKIQMPHSRNAPSRCPCVLLITSLIFPFKQ